MTEKTDVVERLGRRWKECADSGNEIMAAEFREYAEEILALRSSLKVATEMLNLVHSKLKEYLKKEASK